MRPGTSRSRTLCFAACVILLAATSGSASAEVTVPPAGDGAAGGEAQRGWSMWTMGPAGTWTPTSWASLSQPTNERSIVGLRYAVAAPNAPRVPRVLPTFDDVCGGVVAEKGTSQLALVVDPGRTVDAPEGADPGQVTYTCAGIPAGATPAAAVSKALAIRVDGESVCAVGDYPRPEGCSETVPAVSPEAAAADAPLGPDELPGPPEYAEAAAGPDVPSASGPTSQDRTPVGRMVVAGSLVVGLAAAIVGFVFFRKTSA